MMGVYAKSGGLKVAQSTLPPSTIRKAIGQSMNSTWDPFLPMRANSPMDDSNGLVQLLARMKDEHTRSTAAIEALDRSAVESGRRIADQRDMMARMGEEVEQVQFKTVQSAGSARQVSEILEAERAECAALDAESARLEAELAAATAELDAMQQASLSASIESFEGLAPLRCDWRKRCRNGYSSVVALACSLAVLEVEADSVGDERGKRPCSAMRRGCHEPSVDGNWVSSRVAAC